MAQQDVSLDFSENSELANTIPKQPASESIPQPLADWLIRILARIRAKSDQQDS